VNHGEASNLDDASLRSSAEFDLLQKETTVAVTRVDGTGNAAIRSASQ
jgi:hypothetical protein